MVDLVIAEYEDIANVADAIRSKTGITDTMTLSEMASNVMSISGTDITIDSELSETSTNPVQNKVVTEEFIRLYEEIAETNAVASKGYLQISEWEQGSFSKDKGFVYTTKVCRIPSDSLPYIHSGATVELVDNDLYTHIFTLASLEDVTKLENDGYASLFTRTDRTWTATQDGYLCILVRNERAEADATDITPAEINVNVKVCDTLAYKNLKSIEEISTEIEAVKSEIETVETEVKAKIETVETELKWESKPFYSRDISDIYELTSTPEHNFDAVEITTSEIYALYDELLTAYPNYISMDVIGQGCDGQDIRCYHLTPTRDTAPTNRYAPTIVLCCGHHGWEKASAETMLLILRKMLTEWKTDKLLEVLRFDVNWHIIPVINTSGWDLNSRRNSNHIDLNRNYAEGWSYRESDTTASNYQGESALSESETQAVTNFLNSITFDIGIDFHDFGTNTPTQMTWVSIQTDCISESQIAQAYTERISRILCKQFDYLANVDPNTLGYTSESAPMGKCVNALKARANKYAYTFEVGGIMPYETDGIRYSDDHVKACVQAFANFIALNLDAMKR